MSTSTETPIDRFSSTDAIEDLLDLPDRELAVALLWHDGRARRLLLPFQDRELRFLGDGFGDLRSEPKTQEAATGVVRAMSSDEIEAAVFDWSHIRDSSDEAIARIARAGREIVFRIAKRMHAEHVHDLSQKVRR